MKISEIHIKSQRKSGEPHENESNSKKKNESFDFDEIFEIQLAKPEEFESVFDFIFEKVETITLQFLVCG